MSISNSFAVVLAAAKDTTVVHDTVAVVAQNSATVAAEVLGKGGFSTNETIGQMLEFQLTGLLVVFLVLGGLTLMCSVMAWLLKTIAPDHYYGTKNRAPATPSVPVATPVPASLPSAPASIHPGLADEELVAILAVAATEAIGQAVSVVKFRHMGSMDWTWSVQGRVSHHSSHKL
jgi:hypothetical protein